MKRLALIIFILIGISLNAQDLNLFENEIFVSETDTLNYRILKPLDYDPNQQYPVHLFLHGAGERGSDNTSQLTYVDQLFLKKENRENYKSWVIIPQCPNDDRWPSLSSDDWNKNFENKITSPNKSLRLVMELMDGFIEKKQVNKQKVYVSGLSMGVWEFLKYCIEDRTCFLLLRLSVEMEFQNLQNYMQIKFQYGFFMVLMIQLLIQSIL